MQRAALAQLGLQLAAGQAKIAKAEGIPIDPFYVAWLAHRHGMETRFV